MSYLKSASSNLLTCKVSFKNRKILSLRPKIPYLNVKNYYKNFSSAPSNLWKHKVFLGPKRLYLGLWAGMLKNCCHICNQHSPTYLIVKFCPKIRILKFGTKNVLSGCFGQQFWKTTVIFEISGLLLALLQRLVQKTKSL